MPVLEPRHLSSPRQTTNEIDALLHVALGESNFGRASMGAAPEQERVAHTPHTRPPGCRTRLAEKARPVVVCDFGRRAHLYVAANVHPHLFDRKLPESHASEVSRSVGCSIVAALVYKK